MTNIVRVIIDTNVVISAALAQQSTSRTAVFYAIDNCEILISKEVLTELTETIVRPKFDRYIRHEDRIALLNSLVKDARRIDTTSKITDCRDPRDNKFLELAVDGNAQYIVTGDDDLLRLSPYRGIRILTPSDFMKETNEHTN